MDKRYSENTERNPPDLILWISLTEKTAPSGQSFLFGGGYLIKGDLV